MPSDLLLVCEVPGCGRYPLYRDCHKEYYVKRKEGGSSLCHDIDLVCEVHHNPNLNHWTLYPSGGPMLTTHKRSRYA